MRLGPEEKENVLDMLFFDGGEGKLVLLEESLKNIVQPNLEGPRGAGLTHEDSCLLEVSAVNGNGEVRLRVWVAGDVVETVRDIVMEANLYLAGQLFRSLGRGRSEIFGAFMNLLM